MGGGSEKSLSDWMVRQGMVRRGQKHSQGACPGGTGITRGAWGRLRACGVGQGPVGPAGGLWAPPGAQHSPAPSAVASTAPRCCLGARPGQCLWQLGGASGSWEVPGARLGLGRVPAEGAGGCSPENLLLLLVLLGSQLCRFSGAPAPSGVSVLRTELAAWAGFGWRRTRSPCFSE